MVLNAKWLAKLGSAAYDVGPLAVNRWFNIARERMGYPYWSLSAYLKHRAKRRRGRQLTIVRDRIPADEAKKRGVDGVVCGHIHKAEIRATSTASSTATTATGWESCTALAEDFTGKLQAPPLGPGARPCPDPGPQPQAAERDADDP